MLSEQQSIPIKVRGARETGADKISRNKAQFDADTPVLRKPPWIRVRLPAGLKPGSNRRGITAFIVESKWPGVENVHRLEFMGLKGIENGVIRARRPENREYRFADPR